MAPCGSTSERASGRKKTAGDKDEKWPQQKKVVKAVSHSITAKIIGTLPYMPNEYMAYGHVSEKVAKKFPYHNEFLLLRRFVDIVLYISIYLYIILSLLRRIIPVVAMLSFHAMKVYYYSRWHAVLRAD